MAYDAEIFSAASARLEQRRRQAIAENQAAKLRLYDKLPRLAEIERELAQTGVTAVREILAAGGDTKNRIDALKKQNLELQAERVELLVSNRYPPEILSVNYFCHMCKDTGYVGDEICDCFRTLLREEACKTANAGSPLPLFTFSSFNLDFYPDRYLDKYGVSIKKNMENVFLYCKNYARNFNSQNSSLLMLGKTGLGKTHLALSIANSVIEKGYGVIYDTAQNIFMKLEDEYFRRSERKYTFSVFDCDLLIIDELPDFVSQYSVNTFYNIINTRMLKHLPIIVSTNLSEKEIEARYGERIFSRLIGEFELLKFFGNDIRQLKLQQRAE
jgi:DNA replication protein DnaC